jgi:hypothetical protein
MSCSTFFRLQRLALRAIVAWLTLLLPVEVEGAMSKASSFFKAAMPLIYAIVAVPVFLWFLVDGFGLFGESACFTEVQGRLSGPSGFDFEISETSCFFDPAVSVFVSADKRKKTLLLKYVPVYVGPYPTITSVGEHTVQISVSSVSSIFCRKDKWGTLTVKYDIGPVEYPSVHAQDPEC